MMMDREELREFSRRLQAMLLDGDEAVLIEVGARAPTPDFDERSTLATIRARVGKQTQTFTGNGSDIDSSICIARMRLRDARASHERALAKAKADKVA